MTLHDRLEPLAGLAHRIVHTLTELLLNLPQLRPHAFANCQPSLTTIDVHREVLGQMAADVVFEFRESSEPIGKVHEIVAKLVVGNSTGLAPAS